jgi:hypothetical protein
LLAPMSSRPRCGRARAGDVFHALRDRPRDAPRADGRLYSASRRGLHVPGRPHDDGHRRGSAGRLPGAHLRPGPTVERTSAPHAGRIGGAVVQTPFQAPHGNAHAERVIRSIKDECLNRVMPMGERRPRGPCTSSFEHDHRERHHPGLGNERINGPPSPRSAGGICRRPRLGGLLNDDCRVA